jgi:hypothetical protein
MADLPPLIPDEGANGHVPVAATATSEPMTITQLEKVNDVRFRSKGKDKEDEIVQPVVERVNHHPHPAPVHQSKATEAKKERVSSKSWLKFLATVEAKPLFGLCALVVVAVFLLWFNNSGPKTGKPDFRSEMLAGGLSAAYIDADIAAVDLYHRKRQLSQHPIEHVSYILPKGTDWNVRKYFLDRLGSSVISGEKSLADAERKGFYIKKFGSFVVDRYCPSTRNVIPSLLNINKTVEELARNRDKFIISSKNLYGCVSSHQLGITASFVVMRVSANKLAEKRDPRNPTALDYLEKVANATRMTFPDLDPKGVYFYILDPKRLPETHDRNILIAARPNRERPVVYKDILGDPSTSNYKSVHFLIENRIHGTEKPPSYNLYDNYLAFVAPGEVAVSYLDTTSGVYKIAEVKGEVIGCIEKNQRYANAKGFDNRRLVSREYLEGKMEEADARRFTLATPDQIAAEERQKREMEELEKQAAEIQARLAEKKKPVEQPQYSYDDISEDEEAEMKASDAALNDIAGGILGVGEGTDSPSPKRSTTRFSARHQRDNDD